MPITGVATAVTAFVGRARRGAVCRPVPISSYAQFERRFGGLWGDSGLGYAVRDYYRNGGSRAVVVRLPGGASSPAAAVTPATVDVGGLGLAAASPGSWGNALQADVVHATGPEATRAVEQQGVSATALFHLTLREGAPGGAGQEEAYRHVTVVDGPRRVDDVLRGSELATVSSALPTERPGARTYVVADDGTAGSDGGPLVSDDYVGGSSQGDGTGLYSLLDADLFTILSLPPSAPDGDLPDAVWAPALALCRDRRALLLVDPPAAQTSGTVSDWPGELGLTRDGRNGAVYFPRLRQVDPVREDAVGTFVPSGAVAGVLARIDAARGVWKAPAGTEADLRAVSGLALSLTDRETGELNAASINCLRTFHAVGPVVWGARTLHRADVLADEYKYVPVRRLALFLEESLRRGLQWAELEPNDEPLWAEIRASVGAFLQGLFRQGAFQGSSPRDAYFVRCDGETTTRDDIDRGVLNVVVGFAPLRPAEFVVLTVPQKAGRAPT